MPIGDKCAYFAREVHTQMYMGFANLWEGGRFLFFIGVAPSGNKGTKWMELVFFFVGDCGPMWTAASEASRSDSHSADFRLFQRFAQGGFTLLSTRKFDLRRLPRRQNIIKSGTDGGGKAISDVKWPVLGPSAIPAGGELPVYFSGFIAVDFLRCSAIYIPIKVS